MKIPRPNPGNPLDKSWFPRFYDAVFRGLVSGDKNIRVKNIDGRYQLSLARTPRAASAAGNDYNGPFKVIQKSETETDETTGEETTINYIAVVDGACPDDFSWCGTVYRSDEATWGKSAKIAEAEWPELGWHFVWLVEDEDEEGDPIFKIKLERSLPPAPPHKLCYAVGRVNFADGKIIAIEQLQFGDIRDPAYRGSFAALIRSAASDGADIYVKPGRLIAGSSVVDVPEATLTVANGQFLTVEVTYDSTAREYAAAIVAVDKIEQEKDVYRHAIAQFWRYNYWNQGVVNVIQLHHGDVHVAGRLV